MDRFLIQVNASIGYANIKNNQQYANEVWESKPEIGTTARSSQKMSC